MNGRFPSRRRAEQFARAVDGAESAYDAVLEPMVAVAGALRAAADVEPGTRFRADLRDSLVAAAATELAPGRGVPPPPERFGPPAAGRAPAPEDDTEDGPERRRRRLVVLAGSLVLVGGMSGGAAASQQALPGDPLYPIKRGIERVQLGMAGGAQAQGHELLEQAETRLAEVERLAAGGIDDARVREDVTATLQRFATDAGRGGDLLVEAYREAGEESDLVQLRRFTGHSADRLGDLADDLPTESQPALRDAVTVVETLDQMAVRACPSCTSALPAVDLDVDVLSLPRAGDGDYLVPDAAVDPGDPGSGPGPPDAGDSGAAAPEAGSGAAGPGVDRGGATTPGNGAGAADSGSGDRGAEQGGGPAADPDLPLPTLPDDILGGSGPADDPTAAGRGGGALGKDGPVLGDDGVLGKDGPVLGKDGPVLGKDGLLGGDGVAGSEGPVLGDDGLAGRDGPLLGDDGVLGKDGPVLGDDGVLGKNGLLGGDGGLLGG